ncbi:MULTISPECIES: bifunctional folylpolyglutamate synthase/dihydrofolate synthase [Nocardiopsis]|uniref:Dihydrofolate synthase/folylpolyglutamate synthase n=1 Tax=Nocardiopsis dassonvillei (strain ATCC 23218 / DSM 43111 / CIP 107115 / JCM 7437 / KCTC 9190 / NBRC 14626 / NCTC 10488 / NRRL B-5397 / IMRU 509) TaxID=446468 RepID=D7B3M9_NOCDD|nr:MULTISPECIES: folylpolyglutamate synthase/dihydrofolate synthase family protein [Nocardiopsis]ADH68796.1 FolC bifunctional protein [Nocardiopsis dassonvillei subsp. dassonvillei DSM 43111]APC36852.1 dihydrofolate synthase [Nocardiopsis dassonvillei]MCK9870200.1 bifunctional folylpolyglutamate synthase/dihydrofolate synthase [Nocardiopsis dassonvillei]NKY77976.1 bifunctional folylpolyglutamate synthase/dihydrofolate synthase [Nocardiopsis dassonvillei]VEI89305.1 Folylpolyglutamate synthase [
MSEASAERRYAEVTAEILARAPESDIDPRLDRVRTLLDLLGDPHRNFRAIHVTGTNGKTSTARMIDALMRGRGLRVGRYTSPHLRTVRERIVIDGEPISQERFVAAYDDIRPYVEMADSMNDAPLSFFEILTVMAYAVFADAPVDVAVVEVGMGGRWDATNVIDGDVAVVTPIGIDHTEYLPDTVEGIAEEKAGIIKPDSVAVLAQQPLPAAEALVRNAAEVGARVAREGLEFGVTSREIAVGGQQIAVKGLTGNYENLFLPLFGAHQAGNAAVALAAVEAFASSGDDAGGLDPAIVAEALAGVDSPGRMEVVRTSPTIIADAAHNPAGMTATAAAVEEAFTFSRLVGVVAIMADKDVEGILEPLEPLLDEIVVTRNSSPRSLEPERLSNVAQHIFGEERVHVEPRLDDAIDRAVGLAEEGGEFGGTGVLVTGSVVTAGDAVHLLRGAQE